MASFCTFLAGFVSILIALLALGIYLENEIEIDYSVTIKGVTAKEVYAYMTTEDNMVDISTYTLRVIAKDHKRHQNGSESVTWTTYTHYPGFPIPTFYDNHLTLFPANNTMKHTISALYGMLHGVLFYYCSDTSDGKGVIFREETHIRVSKLLLDASEGVPAYHIHTVDNIKRLIEENAGISNKK